MTVILHFPSAVTCFVAFQASTNLSCPPPPVVPRPRLLRPVGQLKRLLRQRLPEQIQGTDGLLLRPEGESMPSPPLLHF